jgi:hypothetical protein
MTSKLGIALFVGLFLFVTVKCPTISRRSGGLADVTFAIAHEDMPSGVYYDRDFDWPTGEALWLDVPVWVLQLVFVSGVALCTILPHRRRKQPNQALHATAAAPGS